MKPIPAFVIALHLSLAVGASAQSSSSVSFSNPDQPRRVEIRIAGGNLAVRGVDGNSVSVTSTADAPAEPREDGLRVLSAAAAFILNESDNVVRVESGPGGNPYLTKAVTTSNGRQALRVAMVQPSDFTVTVPRDATLVVTNQPGPGGGIEVSDLSGDVEIHTMMGDITLDGLGGGALVESMNGDIDASFANVADKPISMTAMRGRILVRVPNAAQANVRLRTFTGDVLTDFEESALPSQVEPTGGNDRALAIAEMKELNARLADARAQAEQAQREAALAEDAARKAAADAQKGLRSSGARPRIPVPMAVANNPPYAIPPMTGGKLVTGELNGGGTEISLATMNGDVILRKLTP